MTVSMNFAGREVSCRALAIMFDAVKEKGLPPDVLTEGLAQSVDFLFDTHQRVSWADFNRFMQNAGTVWTDDELIAIGRQKLDSSWLKFFTLPARMLYSVEEVYQMMARPNRKGKHQMITCLQIEVEDIRSRRIDMGITVPHGMTPSREFNVAMVGVLGAIPRLFGLNAAEVEMQAIDQGARYLIRLPKRKGGRVLLNRLLFWPSSARAIARELEETYDTLHERYVVLEEEIAERKRVEKALSQSEERYRSVVSALTEGVILYDKNGVVITCNASAERLLGYPADRLKAVTLQDEDWGLIHEDGTPVPVASYPALITLREGKPVYNRVLGFQRPNGKLRWFLVNTTPLYHEEDELPYAVVVSFADVTERKWVEREREQFIEELEAKNAELERFTYTVSHDLKSPLVTIKGFLGMLQKDMAAGNAVRIDEDIAHINHAADVMSSLLDELLHLSRIGHRMHPPEQVDLAGLAREAVELLGEQINENSVEVNINRSMPAVRGDRIRLLEIYQNLLDNAIKFMGDQGTPRIDIGGDYQNGEIVCYVSDNGTGIDPRYHEKIFGLFEQLTIGGDGTGIGLALVKRIVEMHGGRIWVESDGTGRGSTFWFTFPANL